MSRAKEVRQAGEVATRMALELAGLTPRQRAAVVSALAEVAVSPAASAAIRPEVDRVMR